MSAVRILEWLARTPDLKFRQGAAALLSQVAQRSFWADGTLPPGTRWNEEVGDADGVVPLVIDPAGAGEPGPDLARIARQVARRIREAMPHCPVQAVVGVGFSYAQAQQDMITARHAGRLLVDSPAIPPETIMAKPCDQCQLAAATRAAAWRTGAGARDLCDDCDARLKAAGSRRPEPGPERLLRKALQDAGTVIAGFPGDIRHLADAGRAGAGGAPSQLALVYAGGNGTGEFLATAAAGGVTRPDIVPAINAAMTGALAHAILGRFPGWTRPPVLVTFASGTDLLVSVPAADAWQFTRTLLTAFSQRVEQQTARWPEPARRHRPSLSAGLVFHRPADPFSDLVQLAGEQLRDARNATRGQAASLAFLDLTDEDAASPAGSRSLSLADLNAKAGLLSRIEAEIPAGRQAALASLLRQGNAGPTGRQLAELGASFLQEAAAGPETSPEAVAMLRQALAIARHWHASPRPESQGTPT